MTSGTEKASALLLGLGVDLSSRILQYMNEGEIEIGQISGLIKNLPTVSELVTDLIQEQRQCLPNGPFF